MKQTKHRSWKLIKCLWNNYEERLERKSKKACKKLSKQATEAMELNEEEKCCHPQLFLRKLFASELQEKKGVCMCVYRVSWGITMKDMDPGIRTINPERRESKGHSWVCSRPRELPVQNGIEWDKKSRCLWRQGTWYHMSTGGKKCRKRWR